MSYLRGRMPTHRMTSVLLNLLKFSFYLFCIRVSFSDIFIMPKAVCNVLWVSTERGKSFKIGVPNPIFEGFDVGVSDILRSHISVSALRIYSSKTASWELFFSFQGSPLLEWLTKGRTRDFGWLWSLSNKKTKKKQTWKCGQRTHSTHNDWAHLWPPLLGAVNNDSLVKKSKNGIKTTNAIT